MDMLAPTGPVYQAGTLSGNPIATAAANATLDILAEKGCYEKLESSSAMLETGLAGAAKEAGVAVTINRVGSILSCFFTDRPVQTFADVQSTDIQRFKKFFAGMLGRGIYLARALMRRCLSRWLTARMTSRGQLKPPVAVSAKSAVKVKINRRDHRERRQGN